MPTRAVDSGRAPLLRSAPSFTTRFGACVLACAVALLAWIPGARAQSVRDDLYITNGTVNAQVLSGTTLYLGGNFSFVGPITGSGVPVDSTTGVAVSGFPRVRGQVNAVVSDGAGGWYIGGAFTEVGGVPRSNAARVLADQSVSPWNPGANDVVRALALDGATVYLGGDFTTVSGQPRSRLAAVDTALGAASAWNPGANSSVRALRKLGSTLIVGGVFTAAGGQSRNRIAAIDAASGLATAWNPNANSGVFALDVEGATVYAAGQFTSIGGFARNRLAALDAVTAAATAWDPNANNQVLAIESSGGKVYVGGQFTNVGGMPRTRIAALDPATGSATAWDPGAGNIVRALAVDGPSVYAGGDFLTIGGASRSRIAELSATTGLATAWNPAAYGIVSAIGLDGPNVFVAGTFNGIGGLGRNNAAAFDLVTGQATGWNPNANGEVLALVMQSGVLYAGGSFTAIGGQSRPFTAALDSTLGQANAWNPGVDGPVSALVVDGSTVYAGGLFANAGGQPRANLAALDAGTGLATAWNPGADDQVFALAKSGATVYAGGSFLAAGGQPRSFLAALDAGTGLATAWNPGGNGTVRAIVDGCDRVYVGGFFSMIGGQSRNGVAALSPVTGLASGWNPAPNGPVLGFALHDGLAYVCGVFNVIGGQSRNRVAALDPATALPTAWNPNSNGTVRSLVAAGGWIYAAGSFTSMGADASGNVAAIEDDPAYGCPAIALTPPPLASAVAGSPYSQTIVASGGTAPWCFRVTAGALPAGLSLSAATGTISGTPVAAGATAFTITASDARGCIGAADYTLSVFPSPAGSSIAAQGGGLCLTPAAPCVTVPFVFARTESTPVRAVSVTFQLPSGALALCTPGSPVTSIRPGSWLGSFTNSVFQVTDHGGGSYTVDQALIGAPCGVTNGGELFVVDVQSIGADGAHPVTVTSVRVRDCQNGPIAVVPGAPGSVNVLGTPIVVAPAVLPPATAFAPYAHALAASPGTAPLAFALTGGALPDGVTLAPDGELSGTPDSLGSYAFEVTVTDADGCRGATACTLAVVCPVLALAPDTLAAGVAGEPYAETIASSGGFPPYAFAITAGALPPGLTLSAAGGLSGVTLALGPHVFTVTATDSAGCTGAREYTLAIACPAIAVLPAALGDAVVGLAYADTLVADGRAPLAWAVTADSLPAGLALDPVTGEISGTPLVAGARYFTVTVTDSLGCTAARGYTLNVFATPPESYVAALTDSLCLSAARPCVSVPFVFVRAESAAAIGASVTFELDVAKLALCTPGDPAASIRAGDWLAEFAGTNFEVTDLGGGRYTVDHVILGAPCGATGGGVLFTVDVQPVGGDGDGLLTVTQVRVRDCDNVPIPVIPGPPATLPIDNTPPAPVTDLVAAAVPSGNGSGPTTGIALTWSTGDPGAVSLYRAPFGSYPLYDAFGPVTPPDPADAPGAPWTLVTANATPGYVDAAAPRGFWHYVAIVTNACGVPSAASNMTEGTLDYVLGDVSDGATAGLGNNRDVTEDISLLGAHYGIDAATITARGVEYVDVGPTVGGSLTGRPLPDRTIDFEDLFVFAGNYEVSAAAPQAAARRARAVPVAAAAGAERFSVSAPASVAPGQPAIATLAIEAGGRIQAFSVRLAWDEAVVEPEATTSHGFVEGQGGIVLVPRPGTVDAALLGRRERGIDGAGDVATIAFRVLRAGDPAIRIERIVARDAANRDVPVEAQAPAGASAAAPSAVLATALLAPTPHPLRGGGGLAFALAEAGPVELALYGVDGRRVRTLVGARLEPGVHRVAWDGRDDRHHAVAPGVFFLRLTAGGRQLTRTVVLLR